MPKPNEHRSAESLPRLSGAAEIIQLQSESTHEETAYAAKIAKWLALADSVLVNGKTRKEG
jgi:hypothetical protein